MNSDFNVILVGDIVDGVKKKENIIYDVDNPTWMEVNTLINWMTDAGYKVKAYDTVNRFVESDIYNDKIVVFPLWRGGYSRNRTAIVPAYCELHDIMYIGGDATVQTLCQDKSFSKMLAESVGLKTPKEIVLYSKADVSSLYPSLSLRCPFVVKPLYSACSIGIEESSLCYNDDQARQQANKLFDFDFGPVLCEEFICGDEISFCLIEEKGKIVKKCIGVYRENDGKSPFHNRSFTFKEKINPNPSWYISILEDKKLEGVWIKALEMIKRLGKVDVLRIDGKYDGKDFYLIELTPDIHLSLNSIYLGAFNVIGFDPVFLLDSMIKAAINNYKYKSRDEYKCCL